MATAKKEASVDRLIEEIDPNERIDVFKMAAAQEKLDTGLDNFSREFGEKMDAANGTALGTSVIPDVELNQNDITSKIQFAIHSVLEKVASSMDEESDDIHEVNVAPPSMEALLMQSAPKFPISPVPATSNTSVKPKKRSRAKAKIQPGEGNPSFSMDIAEGQELDMLQLLGLDRYIENPELLTLEDSPEKSNTASQIYSSITNTPEKLKAFNIKPAVVDAFLLDFGQPKYMNVAKQTFLIYQSPKNPELIYPFQWHKNASKLTASGIQYSFQCHICKFLVQQQKFLKPSNSQDPDQPTPVVYSKRKTPEVLVLAGRLIRDPEVPDGVSHLCAEEGQRELIESNSQILEILQQAKFEILMMAENTQVNGHQSTGLSKESEHISTYDPENQDAINLQATENPILADKNADEKPCEVQNGTSEISGEEKMCSNDQDSNMQISMTIEEPKEKLEEVRILPQEQKSGENSPQSSKEKMQPSSSTQDVEDDSNLSQNPDDEMKYTILPRGTDSTPAVFYVSSGNAPRLICPSEMEKNTFLEFAYVAEEGDLKTYECTHCRELIDSGHLEEEAPVIFVRQNQRVIEVDPDNPVSKFFLPLSHICRKNQPAQSSLVNKSSTPKQISGPSSVENLNDDDDSDIEIVTEVPHEEVKRPKKCLVFAQVPETTIEKPFCILVYPPGSMETYIQNKNIRGNTMPEKPFVACRSRRVKDHKYLFEWDKVKRRKNIEGDTFSCIACMQFRKNFREYIQHGTTPFVAGNSEKWVLSTDPDYPIGDDHQCIVKDWKEKLEELRKEHEKKKNSAKDKVNEGLIAIPPDFDSSIIHGNITFDPSSDQDGLLVFFTSRIYTGFRFEFEVNSTNFFNIGNDFYQVLSCHLCKEMKKSTENVDKIVPQIFVRNGEIVFSNPEDPYNGQHFCIPENLKDDPNVQRRLRRSKHVQESRQDAMENEEAEFLEEEKNILKAIQFLEEQQDQIDNKIIIAGSKLKKINMDNRKGESSLDTLFEMNKFVDLRSPQFPQLRYRFEMVGKSERGSKVLKYRCAKCYNLVQNRPNPQIFMQKLPIIFYNEGKLATKDIDCPDGHGHWCTNRNPEVILQGIERSASGISRVDSLSKAFSSRSNIIGLAGPSTSGVRLNNLFPRFPSQHKGYVIGKPNLSLRPSANQGYLPLSLNKVKIPQPKQNMPFGNGTSLEMEDDDMQGDKAKQTYFSIDRPQMVPLADESDSETQVAQILQKQQKPYSDIPVMTLNDSPEKPTTSSYKKRTRDLSDSDYEEILDSDDEEWSSAKEAKKNPWSDRKGSVNRRKSEISGASRQELYNAQPVPKFSKIIRREEREENLRLKQELFNRVSYNVPIKQNPLTADRYSPLTMKRFPANTENLQLSTAPPLTSLLSSSSLAQKRPAQTISPSLINQPKRMAPPSESLGGFDLSALLKSKPVSVEVSMGQGATTKDEEDGSSGPKLKVAQFRNSLPSQEPAEITILDDDDEPSIQKIPVHPRILKPKVSKPLNPNPPPMTQTPVVPQVPEGLNLKQLLDLELKKL